MIGLPGAAERTITIPNPEAPGMTLESRVQDVLRNHAAPAMELDGSEIEVLAVSDGIATVRLGALCASCPATLMTVISGLEHELKRHLPEIEILEAVL